MSELRTEDIRFKSANGHSTVCGWVFTMPDVQPKAILQLSHGMCEFIGRYRDFAAFMAQNGYVVCGNDHLGHGDTAAGPQEYGFFGPEGRYFVLKDLKQMNEQVRARYPGLPLILLGHSMGSFFARWFAAKYPEAIDGLIISGTGGKNPAASMGIGITGLLSKLRGPTYRSGLVNKMAFGAYLKQIDKPRCAYDWISRDEEIVSRYARDPRCTFIFTVNGFHEMLSVLKEVSSAAWAAQLSKTTPVLLFSGDKDPVGDYGKGVQQVFEWIKAAGVEDVQLKLYPEGRHEMLNEVNRAEVYKDVLTWCSEHVRNV